GSSSRNSWSCPLCNRFPDRRPKKARCSPETLRGCWGLFSDFDKSLTRLYGGTNGRNTLTERRADQGRSHISEPYPHQRHLQHTPLMQVHEIRVLGNNHRCKVVCFLRDSGIGAGERQER